MLTIARALSSYSTCAPTAACDQLFTAAFTRRSTGHLMARRTREAAQPALHSVHSTCCRALSQRWPSSLSGLKAPPSFCCGSAHAAVEARAPQVPPPSARRMQARVNKYHHQQPKTPARKTRRHRLVGRRCKVVATCRRSLSCSRLQMTVGRARTSDPARGGQRYRGGDGGSCG